ncbi:polyketide antibiotic transporter [Microbacterium sp. BK668]|uniref:ABC transporter permease n=1 Tax=Microbacterium sp. BK668 TaxID=2512118 RepID=UPI001061DDB1|nr:polyketide antibiotic transporter [Microbacterium sp. BK668]TDN91374.1 ABC-2 type transport system permease protein [Microbacterium sp. BK668]
MSRFAALLRQRLRRDWVQLVLWIGSTALLAYASYAGVQDTYGTEQQRRSILAAALANPVILLFRGLPSGAGDGAFIAFLIVPFLCIMAALMSSFLAVRHTRADEETGRAEAVSATAAGRALPTLATVVHGVLANAALGILIALVFLSVGLPADGSVLVGLSAAAVGIVFLGVGLVASQLMRTSRGANSAATTVLIATFLLGGLGNALGTPSDDLTRMESTWLTWLSPFGWAENTRAYDENLWWPTALLLGTAVVLIAVAIALQSVRDVGAAFVPERRGRRDARPALSSNTALVWRLTYPAIIGWAIGAALTGLLATSLGSVVDQLGSENEAIAAVLKQLSGGGSLDEAVITTFFIMVGIFAACCAVQTVVRARQEETHGTAEAVLATPVSRVRWLGGFLLVGLLAVIVIAATAVVFAWLGLVGADGNTDLLTDVIVAGAGQALAGAVFLVVTAVVFVLVPRLTIGLGWTLVVLATVLGLFGPLLGAPEWTTNLSPFAVTPFVSGGEVDPRGAVWLGLAALGGAAASLALMRRRELAPGG